MRVVVISKPRSLLEKSGLLKSENTEAGMRRLLVKKKCLLLFCDGAIDQQNDNCADYCGDQNSDNVRGD